MKQIRTIEIQNLKTNETIQLGSMIVVPDIPTAFELELEDKFNELMKDLPDHIKIIRRIENVK